jgi:hypothetical protein
MLCRSFSLRALSSSDCLLALAAVVMCAAGQLPAKAGVVLEVDVTNPSAVTFTATGAFSAVDSSSTVTFDGISALGFLTSSGGNAEQFTTSTLRPSNVSSSGAYIAYQFDTNGVDLDMYTTDGLPAQVFSTSVAALVGQLVANLSFWTSQLPSAGASGNVIAGYPGNSGGVIGTWQAVAVPEPSTYALAGAVAVASCLMARRRGVKASA